MTNEQLAGFIQQGGNDELLPLLWDKNRRLIYQKCYQYWQFYSEKLEQHGHSFDDLYQESYNAFAFAVSQYNSKKGFKFTTYLNYALKHVIRGLVKSSDVLDQSTTESLEKPLTDDKEGEQLLVGDTVPDESASEAFDKIERLDEFKPLYEAIDSLPDKLREIIQEYYFKGLSYQQIGDLRGLTKERIRQLHERALRALRNGKTGARLRQIYGGDYGALGYVRHKSLSAFHSSHTSEVEDYVLRRCWRYYTERKTTMTEKQKRFCEEYLVDFDPVQAAIRAGYSERDAKQTGQRLLKNANIESYIQEILLQQT